MTSETYQPLRAADGVELAAWASVPPAPRGALLLCHGLSVDHHEHGAFDALRAGALRRGLAVVRFDFRGHGASGSDVEHLRLAGMRNDAAAALGLLDTVAPAVPVVVVGLSFGGAAAIHAAATHPRVAGLVLWYAVVDYAGNYAADSPLAYTQLMHGSRSPEDPPWSGLPIVGVPGWHLPRALLDEAEDDTTPAALAGLRVPVLAFHGTRDRFVDPAPIRAAGALDHVRLHEVRGAGHGFLLYRPWVLRRTLRFATDALS